MLPVSQAEQIIRDTFPPLPSQAVALTAAYGQVLREPILADRPFPPYDRVTMDGIALALDRYRQGTTRFAIQGVQAAGQKPFTLSDTSNCIEIMTGAALPGGCDCVVPVEDLDLDDGSVVLEAGLELKTMQHVHPEGSDRKRGDLLLEAGITLRAPELAIAATTGNARVLVAARPSIAVISTGDELVDVDETPQAHQIRRSNAYALQGALALAGFHDVTLSHVPDDRKAVQEHLAACLERHRVLILSGGVSKGRFDFIPAILNELGVTTYFHGVWQRPGKPMWYGIGADQQTVFGLPGNPVSVLVCCYRYVLPALQFAMGQHAVSPERVVLEESVMFTKPLTLFQPVNMLEDTDGILRARPVPLNTSGDLAALAGNDGFIQLDAEQDSFEKESVQDLWRW